jgi:asparagine synthase (glutamine-hydrolysing)
MCGIAGMVDLVGKRPVPLGVTRAMADALYHRGPDDDGYLERPGLALASRRLSIVGLRDGHQPVTNEDQSVHVVFNGELFDHREVRRDLETRGHRFTTHCDTEIVPHLWEEHQAGMFERLRGQFALALWDERRQLLMLARDRFGICPLFWTRRKTPEGEWLLFASEIKGLLASGMVPARPDRRGINHVFTFFAMPGPVTCFEGVWSLLPGHYLHIQLGRHRLERAEITDRAYWEMDFPNHGEEEHARNGNRLVDAFEEVCLRAVERRLRADVPVVSYLSGGVDSGMVVTLASHLRGEPLPTFTIRIQDPRLDETERAAQVAQRIGAPQVVVNCGPSEILNVYPAVIEAAEGPVIEPASAALFLLARSVHEHGYKVALTGEGSDEWLAGYPWYKVHQLLSLLDLVPGLSWSQLFRRAYLWLTRAPRFPWALARRNQQAVGGHNGWLDMYGLMSVSKLRFYSRDMTESLADHFPFADLQLNESRLRRWHPLHRALYLGARVMLPGLLLSARGDRVAMHSSVETRYPFLDEELFSFLARLHPRWKLHGLRDKYLLRLLAERWLPAQVAWRPKAIFRAPFNSLGFDGGSQKGDRTCDSRGPVPFLGAPGWVDQLLSSESLRKTGYFDPLAVQAWRRAFSELRTRSMRRMSVEMGLAGVLTTQLWHHTFIDGSLADLGSMSPAIRRPAA